VPFVAPADLLVTDPGRVAETVNAQPVVDPSVDTPCSLELGPAYQLVFSYRDGSTAVASGQLYGCRPLFVGDTTRSGADAPWDTFLSLLREQRRHSTPAATLDAGTPSCETAYALGPTPIGGPDEIVAGRFCALVGNRWVEAPARPGDIEAIVGDFRAAEPMRTASVACLDRRQWTVVGVTAWADLAKLQSECGFYAGKGPDAADAAPISPRVKHIVDRLLAEVTSR
jgi:hypothetical protein